jgi:DNA-binding transcriptional regulator YdaS (Cro superfamily)
MDRAESPPEAFARAVQTAGGQTQFAEICGCTQGNISQLLKARRRLPSRFVLAVEAATGVRRHLLRPDLYPIDDLPAGGTLGVAAPAVACDRGAELQAEAAR